MSDSVQASAADFDALREQLNNVTASLTALQTLSVAQSHSMDDFFLCSMGALVYLMSCAGFGCLEAGSVRSTNVTSLLMQNTVIIMITAITYWIIGFAFAFGPSGNPVFGWGWVAAANMSDDNNSMWFFQYTFAAASASIMSGGIAERAWFVTYLIFTVTYSALVYPWATHWTWGGGWLMAGDGEIGYQDFAGSGPVHIVGGTAALMGAVILGPRTGRFRIINGVEQPNPFGGHSTPLVAIGGLILFFGFLGFNGGSQLHISQPGDGQTVALAFVNTSIAGAGGLLMAMMMKYIETQKWSLLASVNGGLAGMVSICAGANGTYQWGSFFTGGVAGAVYSVTSKIVARLHIDDPVDSIGVHFGSGIWGAIAQPIFKRDGILMTWTTSAFKGLMWNAIGAVALVCWSSLISSTVFLVLRFLGLLRLSPRLEDGQDVAVHGEAAYPMEFNPHLTVNVNSGPGSAQPSTNGISQAHHRSGQETRKRQKSQSQNSSQALVTDDELNRAVKNISTAASNAQQPLPHMTELIAMPTEANPFEIQVKQKGP